MNYLDFLNERDRLLRLVPKKLMPVIQGLGPEKFSKDHVLCAACYEADPVNCVAKIACDDIVAMAKRAGHPEWLVPREVSGVAMRRMS